MRQLENLSTIQKLSGRSYAPFALTALMGVWASINPVLAQEAPVERINSLANIEALLNICANGAEIMGIAMGPGFFSAMVVSLIMRRFRFAGIMGLCAFLFPMLGLANPGIVNWIVASMRDTSNAASAAVLIMVILEIIMVVATLAVSIALSFMPMIIALRQNNDNRGLVIGLNLGGLFIPPLSVAALVFAFKENNASG